MSKAIAFALLVDVVFRLILYAIKKSLAPIAVAPVFLIVLNSAGPKSGTHLGSFNLFFKPSYSPSLMLAKFFLYFFSAECSYKNVGIFSF